ncbi:heavy-metal-associated domain-containing protein [Caminibacter sp.]
MKKIIFLAFASFLFAKEIAIIKVDGMTCPLCTTAVKHSLKHTPGVISAKVRLNTSLATVVFDENKTTVKKLLHAITVVGYRGKLLKIEKINNK